MAQPLTMLEPATLPLLGLYAGGLRPLPPEGQLTGIYKSALSGAVRLGAEGLEGDRQADRRYHGGVHKALHHYPAEHYAGLAAHLPALGAALGPGIFGENLSTRGWDEEAVCVGDIFRLGTARIQVSEPRSPCWKLDCRTEHPGLSRLIAAEGLTGWYYRVLEEGLVSAGDELRLLDRPAPGITLARVWRARLAHRPDPAELAILAAASGLSPVWQQRFSERHDWLLRNG